MDRLFNNIDPKRFALLFEAGILLAAIILAYLLDVSLLSQIDIDAADIVIGVLATVPAVAVAVLSLQSSIPRIRQLQELVECRLLPLLQDASIFELALLSLLAGVGEEALFRGVLQTLAGDLLGPLLGLVTASVLFGLAHYLSFAYACFATLFGLYLGALVLLFGNLIVPIIVHALYDFVLLWWLIKGPRGNAANR